MAKEFRDDQGRPWIVALTCAAAKRVRGLVSIVDEDGKTVPFNIIDTATINQTITILRSQYLTVGETLHAILVNQVEERGITQEQFMDSLRGDSLADGGRCIEEELVSFFPTPIRKMVGLIASKMQEVQTKMLATAEAQLEAVTVENLVGISGVPSTSVPESSASTPESGHIEN